MGFEIFLIDAEIMAENNKDKDYDNNDHDETSFFLTIAVSRAHVRHTPTNCSYILLMTYLAHCNTRRH